jgi:ElaB/YqjD/DUF883 family membrane-anchored ribosome-binding protein
MENEILIAREKLHRSLDAVLDQAGIAGESGKNALYGAEQRAAVIREHLGGDIRRNPEETVLIAAGIGVLAGLLIGAALARKD